MFEFLIIQIHKKKQLIKFVISGGTAFSVDLLLLFLLTDIFKIWYIYSAVLAFSVAFFVSFYLQKHWTFRDKNKEVGRQMAMYFFVGSVNLGTNTGGMYLLVDRFALNHMLAQIMMGALIGIGSFVIYRLVIFRKKRKLKKNSELGADGGKKLRVLIATGIYPPDIGGPATMLPPLAEALLKNGFEIKIITYAEVSGRSVLNYGDKKAVVYKIKKRKFPFGQFFYLRKLLELAKRSDVVYATDIYSVGYSAYLAGKILRKKYIIRFAGDSAWETAVSNNWTKDYIMDFQNKVYGEKIEKLKKRRTKILNSADKVIAVSGFMSDLAEIIGVKKDKIKIIYNSADFIDELEIDPNEIEELKSKYGLNKKIIVTSCRLTAWKGVDGVIKILPELIKKAGEVNFLVLGDGPEMENLKKLAKEYNVSDNVFFLGRIKHSETMKYFRAADLYVLNTNYEGFSHALLDAMKSGAPVVTTNVGGNPELINSGEEGILIDYNNQDQLIGACAKILNNKELARNFADNAKNKIKKFSWKNTVDETVELLRRYI